MYICSYVIKKKREKEKWILNIQVAKCDGGELIVWLKYLNS